MSEGFAIQTFSPLRGNTFVMHTDSADVLTLELTDVTSLGGAAPAGRAGAREPFSLLFHGPRTPVAVQRIYRLEHATLGLFEIFLVPIGPDDRGMRYEAIFT